MKWGGDVMRDNVFFSSGNQPIGILTVSWCIHNVYMIWLGLKDTCCFKMSKHPTLAQNTLATRKDPLSLISSVWLADEG